MKSLQNPFNVAIPLHKKGYSIIPLYDPNKKYTKGTTLLSWSDYCHKLPTEDNIKSWSYLEGANVGVCLGKASGLVALDFDDDVNQLHSKIIKLLPESPVKKVGNRGFTAFYKYNGETTRKWRAAGQTVLELLSSGRQTVIPPSIHPDSEKPYEWIGKSLFETDKIDFPTLPKDFVEKVDELLSVAKTSTEKTQKEFNYSKNDIDASLEDVEKALKYVSSEDYETWIQVGMGLKETYGNKGLPVWDDWSSRSSKYKKGEIFRKWQSFKDHGITVGTIVFYAMENGYVPVETIKTDITIEDKIEIDNFVKSFKQNSEVSGNYMNVSNGGFDIVKDAPNLIGDIAYYINESAIAPQPVLSLAAAITATGTIYSHRVRGETDLRTNMYCMSIAPTGAGKEHPMVAINKLFEALSVEHLLVGEPASSAGFIKSVQECNGRCLLQIDEFGKFLSSISGKGQSKYLADITTAWTKMFTKANTKYLGQQYANHDGKMSRKDVRQPCVSILGATVPGRLYESMSSHEIVDGFFSRWLLFETKVFSPQRKENFDITLNTKISSGLLAKAGEILERPTNINAKRGDLASQEIEPEIIYMTQESRALMESFNQEIYNRRNKYVGEDSIGDALWSRAREHCLKLALIAHDPIKRKIASDNMVWAIAMTKACLERSYEAISEHISDNNQEKDFKKVLSIISDKKHGIKKSDLIRSTRWLTTQQRNGIIRDLCDEGAIDAIEESGKGRKTLVFKAKSAI
jgi:hypothetical protein